MIRICKEKRTSGRATRRRTLVQARLSSAQGAGRRRSMVVATLMCRPVRASSPNSAELAVACQAVHERRYASAS